jgi:hypothetical protein
MPKGNTLSRLMIVSLAAAAITAPAATAQPTDPTGPAPDTASLAQDARTEAAKADARAEAVRPQTHTSVNQEMRTEAAKDPSRAPAHRPFPGPPTWPSHPRVITAPQATTVTDDGDGGGVDAPVVALIIAGTVALGGAASVVTLRRRTRVAH